MPDLEFSTGPKPAVAAGTTEAAGPDQQTTLPPEPLPEGQGGVPIVRVGRYLLLGELGRGGMGVVYRAWDPALERTVALKMLLWGGLAGEESRRRFLFEARAVAQLDHPGIVRVLDSDVHEGSPYFTMEYVQGPTLRSLLSTEKTLPFEEALRLVAELAEAVHHAHVNGIVHRDIKPANVLLGEDGRPRLSDFGVARSLYEPGLEVTGIGQVLGTPAYMAPEQAGEGSQEVGPTADVYALGTLLFRLLSGRLPFETPPGGQLPDRLRLPPPSLKRLQPNIPTDLDVLCRKALAPAPQDRYGSALELSAELRRVLKGEPIQAALPGWGRRLQWAIRRHRSLLLGVLGTLVLGLLLFLLAAGISSRNSRLQAEAREIDAERALVRLKEELRPLWQEGREDEASRTVETFLNFAEIRGTHAATQGMLYVSSHALAASKLDTGLEWLARAYVYAEDEADQLAVLLELSDFFARMGDGERLLALDDLLRRRYPSQLHTPLLQPHRNNLDRFTRNIPALLSQQGMLGPSERQLLTSFQHWQRLGIDANRPLTRWHAAGTFRHFVEGRAGLLLSGDTGEGSLIRNLKAQTVEVDAHSSICTPLFSLGTWKGQALVGTSLRFPAEKRRESGLYAVVAGKLQRLIQVSDEALAAATRADLDGDGEPEFYFASGRSLQVVKPGEAGSWEIHPGPDFVPGLNSYLSALFAADLDGDGREELVMAANAWHAYDVRVLRAGATPGTYEVVARRKVGGINDLAPLRLPDGQVGILALRPFAQPNLRYFPGDDSSGLAVGAWLLVLKDHQLSLRHHLPPPFPGAILERLTVGDFDGNGLEDFAFLASVPVPEERAPEEVGRHDRRHLQIALAEPSGDFSPVLLAGFSPQLALQADDDPGAELLVRDEKTSELAILGTGKEAVPALVREESVTGTTAPLQPSSLTQRLEELLELELTDAGQVLVDKLAAIHFDPALAARAQLLLAKREDRRGRLIPAARLFDAASRGDKPELEAPLRAADAFKRLRSWEQELRARETLVRLLPAGSQASVVQGQRMEELKRLLTGPVLDLRFGGGNLNPAISLHSPQLLRVDARAERLLVRSFNDGLDLLSVPLVAASGPIQLELQLDIPRAERAGHLLFGLRQAGGGDTETLVGARFFAWGGGEQLNFQVVSQVRGQREPVFLQRQLDGPESAGRQHLLLEYDPARGTLFLRNNDELVEQQQAAGLIRPGMRLEFFMRATREPTGKALLEVGLSRLLLRGVSLLQEGTPGAANEAARALVEGRLELAEQLIKRLPEASERIPLAFILGMRVGDLSSQKEGLRVLWQQALARDPRAGSILNAALRDYPALILPRLFELGGGRVFSWIFDAWGSLIYAHPRDRTTILGLTSGMSALDGMSLPAHADEQERMLELELRACRARSWLRLDQQLMARSAIRQVLLLAAQVEPGLKRPQNRWDIKQLQSWLELDLAHSFAISGEVSPTVTHLSRAVSLSPQPELLLDEALARPELKAMRSHPELAAILPLTEYRLPGMESEHSH